MSPVSLLYAIRCHWEQQCAASATALGAPVPELPCGVAMLDCLVDCALVLPGDGDGQAELLREHLCFHSRLSMQSSLAQLCWLCLPACFHARECQDLQAERVRLQTACAAYFAEVDRAAATQKFCCAACGASAGSELQRLESCGGCRVARYSLLHTELPASALAAAPFVL